VLIVQHDIQYMQNLKICRSTSFFSPTWFK